MAVVITLLLLCVSAFAQHPDTAAPLRDARMASDTSAGSIHGVLIDREGHPAKNIQVAALWVCPSPRGCGFSEGHTTTTPRGEFHFEHLGLGKWMICADDREAGYFAWGPNSNPPYYVVTVEITAEQPDGEVHLSLPPKSGFLDIHLTDKITGTVIPMVSVRAALAEQPERQLFKVTINQSACGIAHFGCSFLVPPDTAVLVHVSSDGYREWNESAGGAGKPVRIRSGDHIKWDIQLDPIAH